MKAARMISIFFVNFFYLVNRCHILSIQDGERKKFGDYQQHILVKVILYQRFKLLPKEVLLYFSKRAAMTAHKVVGNSKYKISQLEAANNMADESIFYISKIVIYKSDLFTLGLVH